MPCLVSPRLSKKSNLRPIPAHCIHYSTIKDPPPPASSCSLVVLELGKHWAYISEHRQSNSTYLFNNYRPALIPSCLPSPFLAATMEFESELLSWPSSPLNRLGGTAYPSDGKYFDQERTDFVQRDAGRCAHFDAHGLLRTVAQPLTIKPFKYWSFTINTTRYPTAVYQKIKGYFSRVDF